MGIGKRIREARLGRGLTQEELAEMVGVTKGAIANYEIETSHPKEPVMYALINALGVDANFLFQDCVNNKKSAPSISDEAQKIARKYDTLDERGKGAVRACVEYELSTGREIRQVEEEPEPTKTIPLFGNSFAAGSPEPDFGSMWENYEITATSRAEFAVRINGDSMSPYIPDGSIALGVRRAPQVGEIGAFLLDGEYVCKQYCADGCGNVYLFSLNRDCPDITLYKSEEHSLQWFGTIITDRRFPLPREMND